MARTPLFHILILLTLTGTFALGGCSWWPEPRDNSSQSESSDSPKAESDTFGHTLTLLHWGAAMTALIGGGMAIARMAGVPILPGGTGIVMLASGIGAMLAVDFLAANPWIIYLALIGIGVFLIVELVGRKAIKRWLKAGVSKLKELSE